jgi:hypothetical protein
MITRDAEPIAHLHRNPYKPIEFGAHPSSARRRPAILSSDDYEKLNTSERSFYVWDFEHQHWFLS